MTTLPHPTPPSELLAIIAQRRCTTLRHLCEDLASRAGGSVSTHYTPARGALDALLRRGLVLCWSTAKPVYVRAEDAPAVRAHLREELFAAICVQGQATPSRLKSVPLAGLVLGVDLLSELARELLAEGRIVNVGRHGLGRAKIYVPALREGRLREMDPGTGARVLRHLRALHERSVLRDSALNISRKLDLPREDVELALAHLQRRGLLEVSQTEHLRCYGFAAGRPVLPIYGRSLSYAQVVYSRSNETLDAPLPEVVTASFQLEGVTVSLRTAAGRADAAGPAEVPTACPPGPTVVRDLPSPRHRRPALAWRKAAAVRPRAPGRCRLGRSSLAASSGSESVPAPAAGLIRVCTDSKQHVNTAHIPSQTVVFDAHFFLACPAPMRTLRRLGRAAPIKTLGRFLGRAARLLDLSGVHEDARSLATLGRFLARTTPMRTLGRSARQTSGSSIQSGRTCSPSPGERSSRHADLAPRPSPWLVHSGTPARRLSTLSPPRRPSPFLRRDSG